MGFFSGEVKESKRSKIEQRIQELENEMFSLDPQSKRYFKLENEKHLLIRTLGES
jgi:2'-5' RNA ligase